MATGATAGTDRPLVQGWFAITNPEPGVFTIEEPLHEEAVKSSLVVGRERALLIDTGMGVGDLRAVVDHLTDRPITLVNSHAHWDHVGGNQRFADGVTELWIHEAEAADLELGVANRRLRRAFAPDLLHGPLPPDFDLTRFVIPPSKATNVLHGGERFDLGGRVLEVIHAPGHSPGGIVLRDQEHGALFSTDIAYPDQLYAFGPKTDLTAYRRSMTALAELAPVLRTVYPSHGASPMSPTLLPAMRDALDAIASGRHPDAPGDQRDEHRFDGFSVLVRPGLHDQGADAG